MTTTTLTRRQSLFGLGLLLLTSCTTVRTREAEKGPISPKENALDDPKRAYADNVDALIDVLLPAEYDDEGNLISPGARNANADEVMSIDRFAELAVTLGFLPSLTDAQLRALSDLSGVFRSGLNATLDVMSAIEKPLTPFRDLSRDQQEAVVQRAFDDDTHEPAMLVVRAACFIAYLGAVSNDVGLRAVGFPPFEDFDNGIAISGYPTKDGEDYTYNSAPPTTRGGGDDLALILDANGDLL